MGRPASLAGRLSCRGGRARVPSPAGKTDAPRCDASGTRLHWGTSRCPVGHGPTGRPSQPPGRVTWEAWWCIPGVYMVVCTPGVHTTLYTPRVHHHPPMHPGLLGGYTRVRRLRAGGLLGSTRPKALGGAHLRATRRAKCLSSYATRARIAAAIREDRRKDWIAGGPP